MKTQLRTKDDDDARPVLRVTFIMGGPRKALDAAQRSRFSVETARRKTRRLTAGRNDIIFVDLLLPVYLSIRDRMRVRRQRGGFLLPLP